jgi:hypothetical protein
MNFFVIKYCNKLTGQQNGELHNLYASPNITRVIKSRRMRLVVYIGEMRNVYKILVR